MSRPHPAALVATLAALAGCPAVPDGSGRDRAALDTGDALPGQAGPFTREEVAAPGTVTFTELAYHPAGDGELEWIELYNPMVVEVDLSGWSLGGAVGYTFAEGARLGPGAYLVVAADPVRLASEGGFAAALGPYVGRLGDDGGDRLELVSNGGRLIDTIDYDDDDPWPVGADGSGATLSKRRADAASDHAENWTFSAQLGGTPGESGGLDPTAQPAREELVAHDAVWRFDESGEEPAADWAQPTFDDSAWASGQAPFTAGAGAAEVPITVRVTADNFYALYLGEADGTDLRLLAEDPNGDWTTVESFTAPAGPRDRLFLAAWEAPGNNGGPQMTIAEVEVEGEIVGTATTTVEWTLGPVGASPGSSPADPPPTEAEIVELVAQAEDAAGWAVPAVEAPPTSDPWGWAVSGAFDADTRFVWADTFGDVSATNTDNTYALFRTIDPVLGAGGNTELGTVATTTWYRTAFRLDADPDSASLSLACELDDGAVIYLNGVEVLRVNLPAGAIDGGTLALAEVLDDGELAASLDAAALVRGENVLAVELHQAADPDDDLRVACALSARVAAPGRAASLRLNEVAAASTAPFWVELAAVAAVDPAGMLLVSSTGHERVLDGAALASGDLLLVDDLGASLAAGDILYLYDADRTVLLDAVRVGERARARDGEGVWWWTKEVSAGGPNTVEAQSDVVIAEVMYHRPSGLTEEWIELYNRGAAPVDLSGWQLADAVGFVFPDGTRLDAGAWLVVANNAAELRSAVPGIEVLGGFVGSLDNSGDRILLLDALGNPADEVRYFDGGRWAAAADGGGSSLELRDVWADNAAAEAWAASDETPRSEWVEVSYQGVAESSTVGPDGVWQELLLGLLDAGEVLVDDVSVIQDPGSAPVELVRDGGFDDLAPWRLLGTHRHGGLVPDPDDSANSVLRLVATGATEHMHNHVETTLGRPISAREYAISFRARWVSGSNQLNSRLYFNRLPVTSLLPRPERSGTPGTANSAAVDNLGPTFADAGPSVAVPAPGEPVNVELSVADPDGTGAVTLWWAVDGEPFSAVAMSETAPGRYSGTLDGQPAGTRVQLYVEAVDERGASATFPAAGPDSRALLQWDDGLAADNGLHNFRLLMTDADSDWLLDDPNLMSNDLVGATVIYDESQVFWDVGVRAKGSERGRPETLRLGYGVHFHREQPFRGSHTSVLVDRSEGVGFGQREFLSNLVGARVGLVSAEYNDLAYALTPRSEHRGPVELQLDRSSDLVLTAQFADGADGQLFEYELIYYPLTTDDGSAEGQKLPQPDSVVGTPITDLGDDKEAWRWSFGLQNNLDDDDYDPILALGSTLSRSPESVIDVDQWLRGFAFATLVGAIDNYGGDGAQHNARFYARPEDGRVLYFPHDMDFFGGWTNPVVGNGDLSRLLGEPLHRRAYHQHLLDISDRAYNLDYLAPWCDRLSDLLVGQNFDSHCSFVQSRADYVREGASDAVFNEYPVVDFEITTEGGEDFSTSDAEVELRGEGWIDVRAIHLDGEEEALVTTWLDELTWSVRVPLSVGVNDLLLTATNLGGEDVGADEVRVTREGGD